MRVLTTALVGRAPRRSRIRIRWIGILVSLHARLEPPKPMPMPMPTPKPTPMPKPTPTPTPRHRHRHRHRPNTAPSPRPEAHRAPRRAPLAGAARVVSGAVGVAAGGPTAIIWGW